MKWVSKILLGLVLVLLWSCSSLKVQKLSQLQTEKANQIAYCLPKANLLFTFTFEETTYTPGPYNQFTQQFLELTPQPNTSSKTWELTDINHQILTQKDTSLAFVISGGVEKITPENWTQLLAYQNISNQSFANIENDQPIEGFSELTLKKLIIEDSKTSYKTVTIDSVTKRVPIVNTVLRNKTTEEMAKDAAKLLTKIRKRKFRLMSGMNENLPKKGDLALMLDELNQKEQYYLELFIGKTDVKTKTYQVLVKPGSLGEVPLISYDKYNEPNFKKSKSSLVLNISGVAYQKEHSKADIKTEKYLPFKAASNTQIEIKHHNNTIYRATVQLPQLAELQYLPVSFLKHRTIELDAKSGMLKKVQ